MNNLIVIVATFLSCYALILIVSWFRAMAREDKQMHVSHFVMMCGVLVPVVAVFVLMILLGGVFGVPHVVTALTVVLPAGVVIAFQLEVSRLAPVSLRVELLRLGLAAAICAGALAPQLID